MPTGNRCKHLWCGVFNYHRQMFVEYAYAYTEKQAKLVFCQRIAKKAGVHPGVICNIFNGNNDNFQIKKEIEFREVSDHEI